MTPAAVEALARGVTEGNRTALGRAITLVESTRAVDRAHADALLAALAGHGAGAHRVGITGVPGVGKSTLIEALGSQLTAAGHRVAVLAVDPSSARSGGSIMGDKTRMQTLARDPAAFIRPSPSAGVLGGVARRTRETMVLVEAAGYDIVLVETVGVGQSETMVAQMVDVFVVLVLAGAGDDLQGIKRGILELADAVVVTKADGDNVQAAARAAADYRRALDLVPPRLPAWMPRVARCSAVSGAGMEELWSLVTDHRDALLASGDWETQRATQRVGWMRAAVEAGLTARLDADPALTTVRAGLEDAVRTGLKTPDAAAGVLLAALFGDADSAPEQ